MATHKPSEIKTNMKPSTALGFLLGVLVLLTATFVLVQIATDPGSPYKLNASHILTVIGVSSAAAGWIIAGIINIRNSIRQHTVTTLLQSRLSATYMSYADKLSAHYMDYEKRKKENPALRELPTDNVDVLALRYILNYFEFIAIGIKKGDLDEQTLKDSLRGILRKNVAMSRPWIKNCQTDNPSVFCHVLWLERRWAD